ncbi:30S ribosomal protein S6 [Candidatus Nanobsidianus stetteri]|jgi:small subunit ribosomal protein S6e|uniref:30S ribosomal protein S6 n=1 Tax=Nanobsidianus stetteri TaxID=1294122 RepID=A0A2T9WSK8_NANST|nr:30S ribosomal protein S6 [Candidatus Nanobsidianus stetteri]
MANKRKEIIFKVVVSDPKTGKSIQVQTKDESLIGKKIGDIIDGSIINLDGYKLRITGGSGFEGAPMVNYVEGMGKKYAWYNENKKVRVKKLVRGNTISPEIVQINTKIEEYGNKDFNQIYEEFKSQKSQ